MNATIEPAPGLTNHQSAKFCGMVAGDIFRWRQALYIRVAGARAVCLANGEEENIDGETSLMLVNAHISWNYIPCQ